MRQGVLALLILAGLAVSATAGVAIIAQQSPEESSTPGPGTPVSHGGPAVDYVSLIDSLRAAGATVEPVEAVEQPFFSVPGQVIRVNSADVQVFEYADQAAADEDMTRIGPDGSIIGTVSILWAAPPHFYRAERLIVLYVGNDPAVISVLETVLGPQVAGR